jgi:hypothetical protein
MIVPADLQKFVRRKELRYTLKTGYLGVAKQKARFVAGQVQLIFKFLRKGGTLLGKLSDEKIHKLIHRYIKTSIENWDKNFYEKLDDDPPGLRPYEAIDFFEDIRDQLIDHLNNGDFKMLEKPIGELLIKNGINDVDKDSLEYRKLCAEIHKAQIQLMPMQKRHMQCDFSYKRELPDIFPEVFPKSVISLPDTDEQTSESLQKVLDLFWTENSPNWKPRTLTEYKTCHKHLLGFLGDDRMIHTVDYQVGRDYKELLSNSITNRGTKMSPARVDLYLGYAAQVFNWAIKQHYTEVNPFSVSSSGRKKGKGPINKERPSPRMTSKKCWWIPVCIKTCKFPLCNTDLLVDCFLILQISPQNICS